MRVDTDKTPTIGNRLATGLYNTLTDHMNEYLPLSELRGVNYHLDAREVSAGNCPDVGIYDMGWRKELETIRGRDNAGKLQPGLVQRRYRFNIVVHVKGRKVEETRRQCNLWGDAVTACLDDNFQLDNLAVLANAESGDPSPVVQIESDILQAIAIEATLDTWTLQGAVAF